MRLTSFSLLALGAATANAFTDTSPFFLASTSEVPSSSVQLKTAVSLLEDLSSKLSECPTDYYVIASQPGVHSSDFSTRTAAPRLGARMTGKDKAIESTMVINEVVGVLEENSIRSILEQECGAQTTFIDASLGSYSIEFNSVPHVIVVNFPTLPLGTRRKYQLSDNDGLLFDIVGRLPSNDYTLLYLTTPKETDGSDSNIYRPDNEPYQDSLHMELKRDYSEHSKGDKYDGSKSLFQEYQYFTPGIFMGLMATFLFLIILYIAFNALNSLQVPYAAFEKDTSASVQKKAQ